MKKGNLVAVFMSRFPGEMSSSLIRTYLFLSKEMATPNFYGEYHRIPITTLRQLLSERGYDPGEIITTRGDLVDTLQYLDSDIDLPINAIQELPYDRVINVLTHIGFNPQVLPDEDTPENRTLLLQYFNDYRNGRLNEDLLDGEEGIQTYQYAIQRYRYLLNRIPLPVDPGAEKEIHNYTPEDINRIVKYLYRNLLKPGYSNQEIFLSRSPSPLIPFLLNWSSGQDPSDLARHLGMVFPPNLDKTISAKTKYFLHNLPDYEPIYLRPDPVEALPILEEINWKERISRLQLYGDDEIIEGYEITFDEWNSRRDFIARVASEGVTLH